MSNIIFFAQNASKVELPITASVYIMNNLYDTTTYNTYSQIRSSYEGWSIDTLPTWLKYKVTSDAAGVTIATGPIYYDEAFLWITPSTVNSTAARTHNAILRNVDGVKTTSITVNQSAGNTSVTGSGTITVYTDFGYSLAISAASVSRTGVNVTVIFIPNEIYPQAYISIDCEGITTGDVISTKAGSKQTVYFTLPSLPNDGYSTTDVLISVPLAM